MGALVHLVVVGPMIRRSALVLGSVPLTLAARLAPLRWKNPITRMNWKKLRNPLMLLFAPLHPRLELVGPHSSLLLLRRAWRSPAEIPQAPPPCRRAAGALPQLLLSPCWIKKEETSPGCMCVERGGAVCSALGSDLPRLESPRVRLHQLCSCNASS